MTRDPEKLKEYRKRYEEKLKILGVKRLGMRTLEIYKKCHKCRLGFAPRDEVHRKKGRVVKRYHQECWDGMLH